MIKIDMFIIIISLVAIACLIVACAGLFVWNEHQSNIQKKLEYQSKYPYSCAVPDKLWDACVTTRTGGDHPGTFGYYAFENNRTCMSVYYAVTNWDNRHVSTTDGDGLRHYIAEGYDSTGVWHQGNAYVKCGVDRL